MRSVILHTTSSNATPWWFDAIHRDRGLCDVDYLQLKFRGKRTKDITILGLPVFLLTLLKDLLVMRRKYDYVYTLECDFIGLGIALWQSLLFMKHPRHVIVVFIMREKTPRLGSALKYALMTFMFGSVYRVICSSRSEVDYYTKAFGWKDGKAQFVPLPTSPGLLEEHDEASADENYILAAGRVFRDYRTVIDAVRGTPFKLIIVGGAGVTQAIKGDEQVSVREEIPTAEFEALVRRAMAIVVPLVDTKISTGQTVMLQAMAMGKLVIATRTAGTLDYIEHLVDGLLVAPQDVDDMRRAMCLAASADRRKAIGLAARERIASRHLPHHYSAAIRRAVLG
jgi:glycosyltransferase involved in cell wall biosynthesis